jgi:LDH2 family malate/lactate/ureidoglycolate dehydrogenase
LDAGGQQTVDPAAALEGIMLPMAGDRGAGLALMWEVLTGVLAGGSRYGEDVGLPTDHVRPQGTSMFLLAIDPAALMPYVDFVARVDRLVDRLHATRGASPDQGILVPGERGAALAAERERNGVPVPAPLCGHCKSWPPTLVCLRHDRPDGLRSHRRVDVTLGDIG